MGRRSCGVAGIAPNRAASSEIFRRALRRRWPRSAAIDFSETVHLHSATRWLAHTGQTVVRVASIPHTRLGDLNGARSDRPPAWYAGRAGAQNALVGTHAWLWDFAVDRGAYARGSRDRGCRAVQGAAPSRARGVDRSRVG